MRLARRRDLRARLAPAAALRRPAEVHVGSLVVPQRTFFALLNASVAETSGTGKARGTRDTRAVWLALAALRKMPGQEIRQHLDAGGARAAGRGHQMHRAFFLFPALQDHF